MLIIANHSIAVCGTFDNYEGWALRELVSKKSCQCETKRREQDRSNSQPQDCSYVIGIALADGKVNCVLCVCRESIAFSYFPSGGNSSASLDVLISFLLTNQ